MRLVSEDTWGIITVWQEARGEPQVGKIMVAEVIRNRMKVKYFSDGTVPGTVLYPLQFSGWNAHDPGRVLAARIDDDDQLTRDCMAAWADSWHTTYTKGALLYANLHIVSPPWVGSSTKVAEVGNHTFFIPKQF